MTDGKLSSGSTAYSPANKNPAMRNTFKCVLVLGVIAVVCVLLLAVANKFLQVEIKLDRATSDMINSIAPTGASDAEAYDKGYIKMVDLSKGGYAISNIDDFNKKGSNRKVRALYTSAATDGKITYVVESEDKGNDAAIVMLVAYGDDGKISAVKVKSQMESYWDKLDEKKISKAFIGLSGTIRDAQIATDTGATHSVHGIVGAVNIANSFIEQLGVTGNVQRRA